MSGEVQGPLAQAWVEPGVWGARPDYVAVLVHSTGLRPGPTSDASEAMLREAELWSTDELAGREPQELAAINEWRQAYQGFGVKPRAAKSSVESHTSVKPMIAAALPVRAVQASGIWPSPAISPEVGSRPIQPAPGMNTSIQAWLALALGVCR